LRAVVVNGPEARPFEYPLLPENPVMVIRRAALKTRTFLMSEDTIDGLGDD
jgi:hypothetical protein